MTQDEREKHKPEKQAAQRTRYAWMRALERVAPIQRAPYRTFPVVIDELAERFGDKPALFSHREALSYRALAERSNLYTRWALAERIRPGEAVCLLMPNKPEYLSIWLGISRIGGVVALLNSNLRGSSLAHCIDVVEPKHVIVASELSDSSASALGLLKSRPQLWVHGVSGLDAPRVDLAVLKMTGDKLIASEQVPVTISDRALYIYTSGTTGLPKAASISHYRIMAWSHWFAGMMDTHPDDRVYNCLPMYHSVGGVVATGALLVNGGSVFLREKFSAKQFWDDIVQYECTLFQYIGELCRYLVNSPAHPRERQHRIRLCCGNGLREDVWRGFKERFSIPEILEFYAATEANFSLYNVEGKPGAIGRIPTFLAPRSSVALIKCDPEANEPVRNAEGFCVGCAANEPGEAIARIAPDATNPGSSFQGYSSEAESEKKILRTVFAQGDAWFRTGDLMRKDEQGYFYFVDRLGDSFRWKGENISTAEVADAISSCQGVLEASVYGVSIIGMEGRAGMAALVTDGTVTLSELRAHLMKHLPPYAVPLFLRLKSALDITETFKPKKSDLVLQGFDPNAIEDPLYFNDPQSKAFVRVDGEIYERIVSGRIAL